MLHNTDQLFNVHSNQIVHVKYSPNLKLQKYSILNVKWNYLYARTFTMLLSVSDSLNDNAMRIMYIDTYSTLACRGIHYNLSSLN